MSTLRLAPVVMLQVGVLVDDGETLEPGPPLAPQQINLSDLKGSIAYEQIVGSLKTLQVQYDAETGAPA